ncbi:HpcH/HpaI aldolase family protein [Rhodococcus wratislaviensis]|uniref:Putative aldolase n=1 Tax=Rhodococcus wratislaviensis NBRC 100605 TaxID=1219028 RepID=X0Q816_RHOWR|nr:aldolase/citrate lyase family protein [Rhodococcus wratislaviensis]GAF47602.1 putative aldolase [Rhodococcus wratislaviensis NBRC 100605]
MRENATKHRLVSGEPSLGVSLTISDPFVAEVIGNAGFDFVMIDTEHAPLTVAGLQSILMALRPSVSTTIVRTAANDPTLIKQTLDLGAEGIIVPDVTDRESCLRAVDAARYAPAGSRAFGPRRAARLGGGRAAYLQNANAEILVFAMVEHVDAVENIDEILATPGLDGILVGPADLAVSMGHLHDLSNAEVSAAITRVLEACKRHSFPFGIFAASEPAARNWVERGASFVTIGADIQFLDQGLARCGTLAEELRAVAHNCTKA